jgi:hypothetical protein
MQQYIFSGVQTESPQAFRQLGANAFQGSDRNQSLAGDGARLMGMQALTGCVLEKIN